jgi:hypothetical protein
MEFENFILLFGKFWRRRRRRGDRCNWSYRTITRSKR